MADINTATFTGRLGSDIELKCTQSGASVCSFSIAVERRKGKVFSSYSRASAF